jgi:hypothetical protein
MEWLLAVRRFENYLLELGHHVRRHLIESASEGSDDLTLIFPQLFYGYVLASSIGRFAQRSQLFRR